MAEGPYQTRLSGPQPTAPFDRPDLSPVLSRASAAGRRAYKRAYRILRAHTCYDCGTNPCRCILRAPSVPAPLYQDCSCGEGMTATTPLPNDIVFAVATHNQRPAHVSWRVEHGL
jgi:hypothetical protein